MSHFSAFKLVRSKKGVPLQIEIKFEIINVLARPLYIGGLLPCSENHICFEKGFTQNNTVFSPFMVT